MSHALEQINAARIGVIRQSASSKLPTSCLHGYAVSLPRNTPDCPGCNNLHVALEEIEQCPFSLPGGPCRYRAWCGDFPLRRWDFLLEQVGIDVSAPCTHESNSLDDNPAKHARSSRRGLLVALLCAREPFLLFFVFVGLDIVKTLTRCYLQTYIEEHVFTAKKTPTTTTTNPL